jgi:flagellar assembly protein FliH
MSSRIIRCDDRVKKLRISTGQQDAVKFSDPQHGSPMGVEKQAFEQGYKEGERIGKQMGEKMMETAVKRYDRSIQDLAAAHRALVEAMEVQTVRLALEISKKLVQRELSIDPDLVTALASVALKRVHGNDSIALRLCPSDAARARAAMQSVNPAVTVKEDPSLERGDFILDTGQTHLDGRISSQIETIGRALFDE